MTALRHLQPALPAPANAARPACAREEVEHVRAAQEANHLAVLYHRHPTDSLADEQPRCFVDSSVFADGDHVRAHDVARDLSLLGKHVNLRHDAGHVAVAADHRRTCDAFGRQSRRDLVHRSVLAEGDHVSRHHLFDRDHGWLSSLATVSRFALPPERINPARPPRSFPAAYAARVKAPVGSSARCSRVQARTTAAAISSSVTMTISSTSPCPNITSKVRSPIAVVRTPSASVAGARSRVWMLPAFQLR